MEAAAWKKAPRRGLRRPTSPRPGGLRCAISSLAARPEREMQQTPGPLPDKTEAPGLYADFAPRALAFLVDFLLFLAPLMLLARALGLQLTNWTLAALLYVLAASLY